MANQNQIQQPDGHTAALIDLLPVPACLMDPGPTVRVANGAWSAAINGSGRSDPHLDQLLHPDDRDAVVACLGEAVESGTASVECRMGGASERRWYTLSARSMGPSDQPGWLCTAVDVDHPRRESSALRDHIAMVDASIDCIKIISTDGNLLQMNRPGCVALGVPEGSPFGMRWAGLLPPDVEEMAEKALAAARAGATARFPGRSVSTERGL